MPKLIKFKGQKSQDKIRHITIFLRRTECAFYVLREKANFVYEIFVVPCFGESMLPFGARAGILYVGRTPCGGRPVTNISPGTLQESARARKGSRPAPLDTVRFPLYILTKIGKRNRAVPGRLLGGPLMQPAGFFTGCLRATGLNKTPGELGAASLTHRRPYRLLKLSRRP